MGSWAEGDEFEGAGTVGVGFEGWPNCGVGSLDSCWPEGLGTLAGLGVAGALSVAKQKESWSQAKFRAQQSLKLTLQTT